jgi:hypothetical protein
VTLHILRLWAVYIQLILEWVVSGSGKAKRLYTLTRLIRRVHAVSRLSVARKDMIAEALHSRFLVRHVPSGRNICYVRLDMTSHRGWGKHVTVGASSRVISIAFISGCFPSKIGHEECLFFLTCFAFLFIPTHLYTSPVMKYMSFLPFAREVFGRCVLDL